MSMCVFVFFACRLSSTPTADVPCLFLAHSHSSFASGVETARGCGRTSGRGLEGGLLTMPVTSGNQGKRHSFADLLSVSVFLLFSIKNIDKTLHVYFYLKLCSYKHTAVRIILYMMSARQRSQRCSWHCETSQATVVLPPLMSLEKELVKQVHQKIIHHFSQMSYFKSLFTPA